MFENYMDFSWETPTVATSFLMRVKLLHPLVFFEPEDFKVSFPEKKKQNWPDTFR